MPCCLHLRSYSSLSVYVGHGWSALQNSVLMWHWKDDADLVHRQSPCHLTASSAADIDLTFDIVDAFRLSCHFKSLLAVCVMTHYGLRVASFAKAG